MIVAIELISFIMKRPSFLEIIAVASAGSLLVIEFSRLILQLLLFALHLQLIGLGSNGRCNVHFMNRIGSIGLLPMLRLLRLRVWRSNSILLS